MGILTNPSAVESSEEFAAGNPIAPLLDTGRSMLENEFIATGFQEVPATTDTVAQSLITGAQQNSVPAELVGPFAAGYEATAGMLYDGAADLNTALFNDAPVAMADDVEMAEADGFVTGNVLANDDDVDRQEGSRLSVASLALIRNGDVVGAPGADADGNFVIEGTHGTLTMSKDGAFIYTLNAAGRALGEGQTVNESFQYKAADVNGVQSEPTVLSITVVGSNDAPVFEVDGAATIDENTRAAGSIIATDSDAGDTITFSLEGDDADAFTVNSETGELTLKQAADFESKKVYNVVFVATDSTGAVSKQDATLNVADVNEAPVDAPDVFQGVAENSSFVGVFATADPDANDALTYSLAEKDQALFTIDAQTGALSFLKAPDFEKDPISYAVDVIATDREGLSSTRTVSIAVNNVFERSVYAQASRTVDVEENSLFAGVFAADSADGFFRPSYALSGGDSERFTIDARSGEVRFKQAPNFEDLSQPKQYSFSVSVIDALRSPFSTPEMQAVTINVTNVLEAPLQPEGVGSIDIRTGSTIGRGVLIAETEDDVSAALIYSVVGQIENIDGASITLDGDGGDFDYDVTSLFSGLGFTQAGFGEVFRTIEIPFTARYVDPVDPAKAVISQTLTFTLNLLGDNDAPETTDSSIATGYGRTISFQASDFAFEDVDNGDSLSAVFLSAPPGFGVLKYQGFTIGFKEGVAIRIPANELGFLTYVAPANGDSLISDSFEFAVIDSRGVQSALARMTISVDNLNSPVEVRSVRADEAGISIVAFDADSSNVALVVPNSGQSLVSFKRESGTNLFTGDLAAREREMAAFSDLKLSDEVDATDIGLDLFEGSAKADTFAAFGASDTAIYGFGGNDTLSGAEGNDFVFGGDGNDLIVASNGIDTLLGGDGNDTLSFIAAKVGVSANLSSNLTPVAQASGFENLTGSGFDDALTGDAGTNRLFGGNGADTLVGGAGADILGGGAGADVFAGNLGGQGQAQGVQFVDKVTGSGKTGRINVGDQLVFDKGLDFILDFGSGDRLDLLGTDNRLLSVAAGSVVNAKLAAGRAYVLYGDFDTNTGAFTFAGFQKNADGTLRSDANDALVVVGDGTNSYSSHTGYVLLQNLQRALAQTDTQ